MSNSEQDWKGKYLDLIDSQERAEKRFNEQQDVLKRALSRLSVASTGLDEELDKRLDDLRRQLRSSQPKPLSPLVSRLESSVVAFDSRREARAQSSLESLKLISEQLQSLSRDKTADKGLKRFRKDLKKRVELQHQYAAMLEELGTLQTQVIQSISSEPSGFWDKLKNKRELQALEGEEQDESAQEGSNDEPQALGDAPIELEAADAESTTEAPLQSSAEEVEGQFLSRAEINDELEASFDRPRHEPAFSRISNHITRVLTELLQGLQPEPCVAEQALRAQNRIARGLNWFELVPTLEDIRDLILQAFLAAEENFNRYLQQLNGELGAIGEALGIVLQVQERGAQANQDLHQEVDSQLSVLEQTVASANSVEEVKQCLDANLASIREALGQHRDASDDGGLLQQVKKLWEQVQTMEEHAAQQQQELDAEREKAMTDPLTGLANRDAYNQRAHQEIERCQRYGHGLVLAVCDIDHFKSFNDNYGHQVGDRVLKLIAKAISQRLRSVDFIARYGGEEFVVLLPETDLEGATKLLDEIRETIAQAPLRFRDEPVQLTMSVGLSLFADDDGLDAVFARADKALYQAKNDGRNRCCSQG